MEKRRYYRINVADRDVGDLYTEIETASGERFEAELLELSLRGFGARFQGKSIPALDLHEEVTVHIDSSDLAGRLSVAAIVRFVYDESGWCRCGFEFEDPERLARSLKGTLARLFNQRRSRRFKPDPAHAIAATLQAADGPTVKGQVADLSSGGVAVVVRRDASPGLDTNDPTRVSLQLPGQAAPIELAARVRHYREVGDSLRYGLEFEGPFSAEFLHTRRAIIAAIVQAIGRSAGDWDDPSSQPSTARPARGDGAG